MEPALDYAQVGLICGLEVHQQLLTERKLFCNCPAGMNTRTHDAAVLRHMRPTLSELGEYDGTALMEFKTRKKIVYLINTVNACTYEMDDTPPFLVNEDAIDVAIEQCLMLGCDIIDEVHIARKQYLDGSIPTGFQRTAIVGLNGKLPFRGREITVTQVSVEEDSCREVSDTGHLIVWRADRLGTPLIETVTAPDLRTPDEVEEAILLVGRVCRSTGHVRVGMGASRQDVNVSVRGGRRVEIKGVPKATWAPALVHGEGWRQVNLLKLRDELHRRGFLAADDLDIEHHDVTARFADGPIEALREAAWSAFLEAEDRRPGYEQGAGPFQVRAVRLGGLAGTVDWTCQPGRTFAHELRGRLRVIAGLDQQPILFHDSEWPEDAQASLAALREELGCGPDDAVVVLWGAEQDTITGAQEVALRYADALNGVPEETRQPFEDGHTDFERILPGPDRMYPDTDSPPTRVLRERVDALRAALPDVPWVREARYSEAGVPRSTTHFLIRRNGARLVDAVVNATDATVRDACFFFGERIKGLRRSGVEVDRVTEAGWVELFRLGLEQPAVLENWRPLVRAMLDPSAGPREHAAALELGVAPDGWRQRVVEIASTQSPTWPDGSADQRRRFLMGRAMAELRGRVPAVDVAAVLAAALELS